MTKKTDLTDIETEVEVEAAPLPEPEPTPLKMRVGVPSLVVRDGPGAEHHQVDELPAGFVVNVLNVAGPNAWVEIAPGKWACVQGGIEQYLVKVEE